MRTQDLPNLLARGWYLSGTWVVTGEKKAGGLEPRRAFLRDGGWGAVELALRCERLRLGSSAHPGPAFVHPRAANLLGNSEQIWTFGLNWYLNRHTKIQANAVREVLKTSCAARCPGRSFSGDSLSGCSWRSSGVLSSRERQRLKREMVFQGGEAQLKM